MNALITGATGFVGGAICELLSRRGMKTTAAVRSISKSLPDSVKQILVGGISRDTDYTAAVKGVDVVIHAAARVHIMEDGSVDSLDEFRKVNVGGTLNLAKQAAKAGVRRFVFISSIKVNGESTTDKPPFSPNDTYIPIDPYGLSKYEAEQGLMLLAKKTGMEVVIIRPPLVYGLGVKANFQALIKIVSKGVPLPFGVVRNKRSLVALDNLVDFIITCAEHPRAGNETFLISDGEDVSTTELLQKVGKALGKSTRFVPIPVLWMSFIARLVGKKDMVERLFGSLQVDSSKARDLLGWKPIVSMDEQLQKTVQAYKK